MSRSLILWDLVNNKTELKLYPKVDMKASAIKACEGVLHVTSGNCPTS